MNNVQLMGRLVADPELRRTTTGKDCVTFRVACDDGKATNFIPCVAWDNNAVNIHHYFKKGQRILVLGRIQSREGQTQTGEKRTFYEVVVGRFEFIERAPSATPREPDPYADLSPVTSDDDALPF